MPGSASAAQLLDGEIRWPHHSPVQWFRSVLAPCLQGHRLDWTDGRMSRPRSSSTHSHFSIFRRNNSMALNCHPIDWELKASPYKEDISWFQLTWSTSSLWAQWPIMCFIIWRFIYTVNCKIRWWNRYIGFQTVVRQEGFAKDVAGVQESFPKIFINTVWFKA